MSKITIYDEACNKVVGFQAMGEEFIRKLVINNKARSTYENYLRQMSKLALHYNRLPLDLEIGELEEYLYFLYKKDNTSRSSFKHLVYGLRKLYLLFNKEELHLSLPSINRPVTLPVVLSKQEVRVLLNAPERIAEKVMFALVYDTGMRITELTNLLIGDVDLDRGQVHIKRTKNKKHRYVILSSHIIRGIKTHLALNMPKSYLFESSKHKGMPVGQSRIRHHLKEAVRKAGIRKQVCVHTLRHTYATHQLEAGQNIMTVKDSLGHSDIKNTLLYLHIARLNTVDKFGCMDALYSGKNGE